MAKVEALCLHCGDPFDSYVSEERKRQDRDAVPCCSASCRNIYTSLLLGGDGTWVEGGKYKASRDRGYPWRRVRQQYLRSIPDRCEGCGQSGVPLQVHHLHPVAAGGSLYDFSNLMAVCVDCHENMHGQLLAGAFRCSFEGVRHAN